MTRKNTTTTRRAFLATTGTALAVSTVAALPALAVAADCPALRIGAELRAADAELYRLQDVLDALDWDSPEHEPARLAWCAADDARDEIVRRLSLVQAVSPAGALLQLAVAQGEADILHACAFDEEDEAQLARTVERLIFSARRVFAGMHGAFPELIDRRRYNDFNPLATDLAALDAEGQSA